MFHHKELTETESHNEGKPMTIRRICYDESGDLVSEVFFEFHIPYWEERDFGDPVFRVDLDSYDEYIFSEVVRCETRPERRCRTNAQHVTARRTVSVDLDLCGGSQTSPFLRDAGAGDVVVTKSFSESLKNSGLQGLKFLPIEINVNQSDLESPPDLIYVEFTGKRCMRPRCVQPVDKNTCPFCGWGPVICPDCGTEEVPCPECGKDYYAFFDEHEGARDKRFRVEDVPKGGRVIEGSKWDGSDFIEGGFSHGIVTRRAVDWLLRVHAAPFEALPCRVNIEGLDDVQMKRIKDAGKPLCKA